MNHENISKLIRIMMNIAIIGVTMNSRVKYIHLVQIDVTIEVTSIKPAGSPDAAVEEGLQMILFAPMGHGEPSEIFGKILINFGAH